jgi:hypothetical protein
MASQNHEGLWAKAGGSSSCALCPQDCSCPGAVRSLVLHGQGSVSLREGQEDCSSQVELGRDSAGQPLHHVVVCRGQPRAFKDVLSPGAGVDSARVLERFPEVEGWLAPASINLPRDPSSSKVSKLVNVKAGLSSNSAVAGHISSDPAYAKFVRDELGCSQAVFKVYDKGYKISWLEGAPPPNSRVKNNGSARSQEDFVWEECCRLVALGCLRENGQEARTNHPFSSVFSKKQRLLLDALQFGNNYNQEDSCCPAGS